MSVAQNKALERIYKLYIFFLPFNRLAFWPFSGAINEYLFVNLSTVFLWLGLSVILLTRRKLPISKGVKSVWYLYLFMAIYSLIMASILYVPLGPLNGENTFRAAIGEVVFYFITVCSIYFNYYCLSYVMKFEELKKTLICQAIVLLMVGFLQYGLLNGLGIASTLYGIIENIVDVVPAARLLTMDRGVVFFGSEPAAAANICILTVPYLLYKLLFEKQTAIKRMGYAILIIAFIPLFITSGSSSVIITFVIMIAAFVVLKTGIKIAYKILLTAAFVYGAFVAICYGTDYVSNFVMQQDDSFWYLLMGKMFDTENLSNIMRSSTIINDMKIFFDNPITGIGNGLQGYFYNENMPYWALASTEVRTVMSGSEGIINGGGAFFPTYLSAYGIIGLTAMAIFLRSYYSEWNMHKQHMGAEKIIFLSYLVILFSGAWYTMSIRQNQFAAFVLSLPLIDYSCNLSMGVKMHHGTIISVN